MASNGRLPSSSLAKTQIGGSLRKDAAASADRLALAFYKEFGYPLKANDTYRSYARQVLSKIKYGSFAAKPGTSNHGWGVAVDFGSNISKDTSAEHRWMEKNAGAYGWENPTWARNSNPADGQYEPWHWEFSPARDRKKTAARIQYPGKGEIGFGRTGSVVKNVQTLLNKKVHDKYKVKVDGGYGMGTGLATLKFQESEGLKQDGIVGGKTRFRLEKDDTPAKPPAKPEKLDHPPITGVQRAVRAKVDNKWGSDTDRRLNALRAASAYGGGRFPHTVEFAQQVVGVKPDGVWGPKSAAAHTATVKDLQRALHIKADGIYGQKTQAALNALEAKVK